MEKKEIFKNLNEAMTLLDNVEIKGQSNLYLLFNAINLIRTILDNLSKELSEEKQNGG